jgi:glutamate-ammonia-ligase adenylyltransferase
MTSARWNKAIEASADPERVRRHVEILTDAGGAAFLERASVEQARIVSAVLSGSQALAQLLAAHPDWLEVLDPGPLQFPRRMEGLRSDVSALIQARNNGRDTSTVFRGLRLFKQRETLRIAARDLAGFDDVSGIIRELSNVADVTLDTVWRLCLETLITRHGSPWHRGINQKWLPTEACVLGMGKLGGQELNYSSDVDLLFVYDDEGEVFRENPTRRKSARAVMTSHQFFNRVAEMFIAEVTRPAPEGMLFRVDVRLRPEGDAGPLCRSLEGYENYYAQWGRTWERMMLIKARGVAGSNRLAGEFLETVQSFRYPRVLSDNVLREIGETKDRIEVEVVKSGELDRNVKLGRGGIREIEFIVQSQQLLQAGRLPFLQGTQTLIVLENLSRYGVLKSRDTQVLQTAYVFLRRVEHCLQMEASLQTHTIPAAPEARARLSRVMGFRGWADFERARRSHCRAVQRLFNQLFRRGNRSRQPDSFPQGFVGDEKAWKEILRQHSFRDPDSAFRMVREFVEGPGYIHVSQRTMTLARQLLPRLFARCRGDASAPGKEDVLSDPDRVVTRLDRFLGAYGARAVLFELWNSHPGIFDLLLKVFDRSEFLAELAIRTPDLLDELVLSGRLQQSKSSADTLRDLRHGLDDPDQHSWLRRYHQVELMRIGARDILGLAGPEQYRSELSELADAALRYALEVASRRHGFKTPPLAIVGLGKLGGREIDYGSDLDVLFVTRSRSKAFQRMHQVAVDVMDLLGARTEDGMVFVTDARLRPDGDKGLLVNALETCAEYYRERAQLWELQALTRTRAIAGDAEAGQAFQDLVVSLTNFASNRAAAAAYSPDWKTGIRAMRLRIEKERTPAGQDALAIKTGSGGLMDAEFIAQGLCLEQAWHEPNTLRALERGAAAGKLSKPKGWIDSYRNLRRLEGILRRWSYEGETVLPDDAAAFRRVAIRCGYETSAAFAADVAQWRRALRAAFDAFFP